MNISHLFREMLSTIRDLDCKIAEAYLALRSYKLQNVDLIDAQERVENLKDTRHKVVLSALNLKDNSTLYKKGDEKWQIWPK